MQAASSQLILKKELKFQEQFGEDLTLCDFFLINSHPKVFEDGLKFWREFGDVSVVPTPLFFYGMKQGDETTINCERKNVADPVTEHQPRWMSMENVRYFLKLNGQTRAIDVLDLFRKVEQKKENRKIDKTLSKLALRFRVCFLRFRCIQMIK